MDVKEYLSIFRRYWWVIALAVIIGAAAGFATTQFGAREYQSSATLFVATEHGSSVTDAYQNNLFSQERVVSYAGLASSEQVAKGAIDQLKASISPSELRERISAKPIDKTVLLQVSVRDSDPARAQAYADAVSDQLVTLVRALETSRRGGSPAAGLVLVDEADRPTTPTGLSPALATVLGAVGGLFVGLILAVLIGITDKRLRRRDSVEEITGARILGALPADPSRAKVDVPDLAANGLYAERLRELRTNLRFARPDGAEAPIRRIAITSPSSQDGRTTTAVDLAAALAETGQSVVLVDGDLRNPALTDRLPLDGPTRDRAKERGLTSALVGEHSVWEALIPELVLGNHSIAFLPAGPKARHPGELWASDRGASLLDELGSEFDYVIIDTSSLDDYTDGAVVGALSDGVIVVVRIRHTTSSALRRALQSLKTANVTQVGSVITFEPGHRRQLERERTNRASGNRQQPNRVRTTGDDATAQTDVNWLADDYWLAESEAKGDDGGSSRAPRSRREKG